MNSIDINDLRINSFVRVKETKQITKITNINVSGEIETSSNVGTENSIEHYELVPKNLTVYIIEQKIGSIWTLIDYKAFPTLEDARIYAISLLKSDKKIKLIRCSINEIEFIMIKNL